MSKIKGIYAASMSVLNDDLTLNVVKTIEHAELVINQGCHGVAILGSTGQAQLIPIAEKIELFNHQMEEQQKEFDIISTILELSEKHLSINQKEEFHKSLEIILNTIKRINLRPKQTIY